MHSFVLDPSMDISIQVYGLIMIHIEKKQVQLVVMFLYKVVQAHLQALVLSLRLQ